MDARKLKKDRNYMSFLLNKVDDWQRDKIFRNLGKKLKKDKGFILQISYLSAKNFAYADKRLKKDKEFILDIIGINKILRYEYITTNNILEILNYMSPKLKKDKGFFLNAVANWGPALKYADESLKRDKAFFLEAVAIDGDVLGYADESLTKDKEVVLTAVAKNGGALEYADESLTKDKEVVLTAVANWGPALKYADESLKKDKEVVLKAVAESGWAFEAADESLKKDKEVAIEAIKSANSEGSDKEIHDYVLGAMDRSLLNSSEFMEQVNEIRNKALKLNHLGGVCKVQAKFKIFSIEECDALLAKMELERTKSAQKVENKDVEKLESKPTTESQMVSESIEMQETKPTTKYKKDKGIGR